jgi:hypothetical protein
MFLGIIPRVNGKRSKFHLELYDTVELRGGLVLKLDGGEPLAHIGQSARPPESRLWRRGVVPPRRQGFNETPDRFHLLRAQCPD